MVDRRNVIKTGLAASTLLALGGSAQAGRQAAKPNLIHICADDMRSDDYKAMPNLRRLFRGAGLNFRQHFVPFALCAPSRASIFTGLQPHNHGIIDNNNAHNGGYEAYQRLEDNALPVWLTNAGYHVGHVGKFINGYGKLAPKHVPPGYADWQAMASEKLSYTDFRLNENGKIVRYDDGSYLTDVFVAKVLDFLSTAPQPYALFFWPDTPHLPATPDQQDQNLFAHIDMPVMPNFNEADVSDKPVYIRNLPLLTRDQIATVESAWRSRLECLQSLDRGLAAILSALQDSGQIADTHIAFTSDNGFLLGEHRVDDEKGLIYEEAVKVPLYWLAPGGAAATRDEIVSNVDVTAAFVELSGATAGRTLDGTSLVPLLKADEVNWNSATLLQCGVSSGIVTEQYRYMEWFETGEIELYDMSADPYQLQNVAGQSEYAEAQKHCAKALAALQECAGETCSWKGQFPAALR